MKMVSYLTGKLPFAARAADDGAGVKAPARATARRSRFLYVLGIFIVWTVAISMRLVWLQVVMRHVYLDKASRQQQRTFEVEPRRGILYDRNLHEMAVSVLADSVFVVPYEITDSEDPAETARAKMATAVALAKVVHTDPDDSFTSAERIDARLVASRDYAWIARGLDASVIARCRPCIVRAVPGSNR